MFVLKHLKKVLGLFSSITVTSNFSHRILKIQDDFLLCGNIEVFVKSHMCNAQYVHCSSIFMQTILISSVFLR